ncbi:hypothetical protein B0H17DRAFT_1209326 [Mycena rosella]|uniref:Uncharacterized protein n=1 Tax=Mycena rosella TaxID=1033263 RepID=A0AAD7CZ63_MYCRO|nr:hypothetical protein B0H17DRAFT_1209326 [Mycena rosella]
MRLNLALLFLFVLLILMEPLAPGPSSSSLACRRDRSVRDARHDAMRSPYASPRRRRLEGGPNSATAVSSLDRERSGIRDAERQRQISLQETPSQRHRRVPRQHEEEENRVASPTPGFQRLAPHAYGMNAKQLPRLQQLLQAHRRLLLLPVAQVQDLLLSWHVETVNDNNDKRQPLCTSPHPPKRKPRDPQ